MKEFKHILNGIIWSSITLYFIVGILLYIPSIQEYLGSQIAFHLSSKLNTKIEIGRIDVGLFNRVIIDDVLIYDQDDSDLVKVGRLSSRIDLFPLLQGKIHISSVQLFGAAIRLTRKNEQSSANYQFLIDAFSSNDSTSNSSLDLRINSIIIRHSHISYDQLDALSKKSFDSKHIDVKDVSAHMILKVFTNDSINVHIKRLAFKERSGFNVNRLSFKLVAGKNAGSLTNFQIQLPYSSFNIDDIDATYRLEDISNTLKYTVNGINATLDSRDLASFFPFLKGLEQNIHISTKAFGSYSNVIIPEFTVSSANQLVSIKASASVSDIDSSKPQWHSNIDMLNLSSLFLTELNNRIKGIPPTITKIGNIRLTGKFHGIGLGSLSIHSDIFSDAGDVSFSLKSDSTNYQLSSKIVSDNMNLKRILDIPDLGIASINLSVTGNNSNIVIKGELPRFDFKDYYYHNISLDAICQVADIFKGLNQIITAKGTLTIDDSNLHTKLDGLCRSNGKNMLVQLQGDVDNLSPNALHLSSKWGEAIFGGQFRSDIKASNLNDAEGSISINNFYMRDSSDIYQIDHLQLQSGYQENKHFLNIKGDMGSIELEGLFDWDTLPQSFIDVISSRLPTLPGLPKSYKNATNDFSLAINIHDTEWLSRLAKIPFIIHQPISLNASINDMRHELNINGHIPSFMYETSQYKDAIIHITSPNDSVKCDVTVLKIMDDDTEMGLSLNAKAYDNQLATSFSWNNHATSLHDALGGELNTLMQLYTDDAGEAEAYLHINPSHIVLGGAKWDMMPCDIFYTKENLNIENFSVKHGEQHLSINGIASKQASDTITLDLKDIDVEYVLDLVNFHPVKFEGLATGNAYITQPFDSLSAMADLTVKEFKFENGRMGTLNAHAIWNKEEQQIDIDALAYDGPDAQTIITGYVSPVRNDINLDIKGVGTYIDFVHTYSNSFLKDLTGHAYGDVRLVGPLGAMDLLGKLVVDGQATVTPLGTTYKLRKDTIEFVHDDMLIKNAAIYDKYDNTAIINGGIHHENLSNLTFDLNVETPRLLAYDFSDFGNEIFCGTVISQGNVDLHGRPGEIVINCNVTPLNPTIFKYNASSADAISNQEFISWNEKRNDTISTVNITKVSSGDISIPTDIYLNFLINATPNSTLRLLMDEKTGDYITLNGSGVLRASYHNKGAFTMYGTYTVERGNYGITIQNIIKKNFQFSEGGTIVFGGNPMNANLDLQAIHTVNGVSLSDLNIGNSFSNNTIRVNCLMNILGQAGSPRVEFDLDMPTVNSEEKQMIRSVITNEQEMNQQVLYLLGIGRFYTQGINNSNTETQEYGQTELAMQSFLSGTLSTQINGLISEFVKNDNWNFGANISTGNEGWHNAEYEGLVSGRLFNNRLLINGQFGYRDNARQATPSFIGDFDIRYLLQPNGNLALKVYNQTNDRYFTRSSLNTQGLGLIIKKDFDGISELFTRRKK